MSFREYLNKQLNEENKIETKELKNSNLNYKLLIDNSVNKFRLLIDNKEKVSGNIDFNGYPTDIFVLDKSAPDEYLMNIIIQIITNS